MEGVKLCVGFPGGTDSKSHKEVRLFFWGGGGMVHLMGSKKSWCSPPKNLQMSSQTKSQENADSLEKLEPYVRPSVYICV